jgi:protein gp37
MKNSAISWTHHTFNPWIGCTKISPACTHCYADTLNLRYGKDLWGPRKERQKTSRAYWRQPLAWDREAARAGERKRVFCASMADVFDPAVPLEWRVALFELIQRTPN